MRDTPSQKLVPLAFLELLLLSFVYHVLYISYFLISVIHRDVQRATNEVIGFVTNLSNVVLFCKCSNEH